MLLSFVSLRFVLFFFFFSTLAAFLKNTLPAPHPADFYFSDTDTIHHGWTVWNRLQCLIPVFTGGKKKKPGCFFMTFPIWIPNWLPVPNRHNRKSAFVRPCGWRCASWLKRSLCRTTSGPLRWLKRQRLLPLPVYLLSPSPCFIPGHLAPYFS